jgi:cellulose synthase/poly-beta-1,6-N-acetylglucosamine synthase-like glycosyltransferase
MSPPLGSTEVVSAVGEEAPWPEEDTLVMTAVAEKALWPEEDTLVMTAVAADVPGLEADAEVAQAVADVTAGPHDAEVAQDAGDDAYWREIYAEILPSVTDKTYRPHADDRFMSSADSDLYSSEADTLVFPAITDDEPPRPRRRRRTRRTRRKPDLTLAADITELYSKLTGEITKPSEGSYRVQYRHVTSWGEWFQLMALMIATLLASAAFFIWLIEPSHYPDTIYLPTYIAWGSRVMYWTIVTTEGLRLLNSATLCWCAAVMHDPVPVEAPTDLRVAFITCFVPDKEPLSVLMETLTAAKAMRYGGPPVDIWVLDEGNDPLVKRLCEKLGVHHFSRHGLPEWNIYNGPRKTAREKFGKGTKHGNINAWREHLKTWTDHVGSQGISYDVVAGVDVDHAPLPCFLERYLGYFRDPDVAYVIGPQVYANAMFNWIARAAEAMNHVFHAVIQSAGNFGECAMFVGTSNIWRIAAFDQVEGIQPSITEDLATAYAVLGTRNPATGNRWKSVYDRSVVAYGEGPDSWTALFRQQQRWARGANELLVTKGFSSLRKLSLKAKLHYLIMMMFYPTVALSWLLGVLLTVLYMALGSTGIHVQVNEWAAFYIDVFTMRLLLYLCLRRFNVSPHEAPGSFGVSGLLMSVLCTPFYSTAFIGAVLRRTLKFDVTPKGGSGDPDRLFQTFRKHWFWAGVSAASLVGAFTLRHAYPANMVWTVTALLASTLPILIWSSTQVHHKFRLGSRSGPGMGPPPTAVRELAEVLGDADAS